MAGEAEKDGVEPQREADANLVHLTSFFRDPEAYEALARLALPDLLRDRQSGDPLRVWSVGCATGEEAYSLAILLVEQLEAHAHAVQLHVFATDVNDAALDIAQEGLYSEAIANDVSPERLARFFQRTAEGYRVSSELRGHVTFAHHDVVADPPILRLDLIACRNVMMFLDRFLQDRVSEVFRYALRPSGFLWLGQSEPTLGSGLEAVHRPISLYRNMPPVARLPARQPRFDQPPVPVGRAALAAMREELMIAQEQLHTALDELHVTKQELASVEHELRSVGEESRYRLFTIDRINREVDSLLGATHVAMLVLDQQQRVLRYTRPLEDLFNIRTSDRARPVSELTHRLPGFSLDAMVRRVLSEGVTLECDVQDVAGRWFLVRIRRYHDNNGMLLGVIATFVDITSVKIAAHMKLDPYRELAHANARVLYRMSPDWQLLRELDSRGLLVDAGEPRRDWLAAYIDRADRPAVWHAISHAIGTKSVFELEHRVVRADGSLGWVHSRAIPLLDANGDIYEWVGCANELTDPDGSRIDPSREPELARTPPRRSNAAGMPMRPAQLP